MTRTERLLRLARERGDLAAVAILETRLQYFARVAMNDRRISLVLAVKFFPNLGWSEAEMRAAWGDR